MLGDHLLVGGNNTLACLNCRSHVVKCRQHPTDAFDDDQGIAFVAAGTAVTPSSFGVLADGVSNTPATATAMPGQQTPGLLPTGGLVLAGLAARYLNLTVRRTTTRTR